MRRRWIILLASLASMALVASACGARLDDDQINAATGDSGSVTGTGGGITTGGGTSGGATGGTVPAGSAGAGSGGDTGGDATPGADPGDGGGGSDPAAGDQGGTGEQPDGGGGQTTTACTGATGTGVSGDTLTVGVVSDRSGPIPGLFESTIKAVNAWANFANQQGGVCGLQVAVKAFDSKTDAGANRAATIDACNQVFALVGSVSAFDGGGAAELNDCGLPDIPAFPTSVERGNSANTFAAYPNVPQWLFVGPWNYYKAQFPGLETKAAMLYTDSEVPKSNALKRVQVLERDLGFTFVVERAVSATEANYGPFVADMKQKGVRMAAMVSDQSNLGRFVTAFKQQNYQPDVIDLDSAAYDRRFAQATSDAAEKVLVWINTVPVEEGGEIQEFQFLQGFMGEPPDYFAVYAWSAARLFQTVAGSVDGELTRENLLAGLGSYGGWDGFGLHAQHDIGNKKPSPCFVFVKVSGDGFVRAHPASGFDCDSGPVAQV